MPLIVRLPKNKDFIKQYGTYKSHLNVLHNKKTAVQRLLGGGGLASYEKQFQTSLLALCELNEGPLTFYDVGAHIGLYSALIGTVFHNQNPQIIAFEPTPETANEARQLCEQNDLDYAVMETAVSDGSGFVDLFISGKAETSNSLNADFRQSNVSVSVPVITVDQFVSDCKVPPSILKVDVETFEANVLRGALTTIETHRPIVTLEILTSVEKEPMIAALKSIEAFGYSFYRVETRNDDWVASTAEEAMEKFSSSRRDWICSPAPLGQSFFEARARWKKALKFCTELTNVMIPEDEDIPSGCFKSFRVPK